MELSDKSKEQLLFMYRLMTSYRDLMARGANASNQPHPKVKVGCFPTSGCFHATAIVKDLGLVSLIEQNSRRSTIFADAARQGHEIAWVIDPTKDGAEAYTGWVVAQLKDETEPKVYEKEELILLLNPLLTMMSSPEEDRWLHDR